MKIILNTLVTHENIDVISLLNADYSVFNFIENDKNFSAMINSQAGIIPDYSMERIKKLRNKCNTCHEEILTKTCLRAGLFKNCMPQTIITRIYNYSIDAVIMQGDENNIVIDNLRKSIVPDIKEDLVFIKQIEICSDVDFEKCLSFQNSVDYFLFNIQSNNKSEIIKHYNINKPFFVVCDIEDTSSIFTDKITNTNFTGLFINADNLDLNKEKDVLEIKNKLNILTNKT